MDNQDLITPLLTLWNFIKEFANSNFTIALIGSGAGAWAGAAVVQRIIEKEKMDRRQSRPDRAGQAASRYRIASAGRAARAP